MDHQLEIEHLAQAERHVAMGREVVRRQQQIIVELERDGHDSTQARALLASFRITQAAHEDDFERRRQELSG
jgi:hypothetical protein